MAINQPVRWVTKAEATEELEVSLSTLDRKISTGELEVRREGRRVYVRMEGPEYITDEELLRRTIIREDELERTVRELEQEAAELRQRASGLERERDEASRAVSASKQAYHELEMEHRQEVADHKETNNVLIAVQVTAFVLLVLLVGSVLLWWFVLK